MKHAYSGGRNRQVKWLATDEWPRLRCAAEREKEKTLCRLGLALRHKGYGKLLRLAARKMEIYMFVSVFLILRTRAESEDGKIEMVTAVIVIDIHRGYPDD